MYEKFGSVVDGSSVEFRLFLPDAAVDPSQYVRGSTPCIKNITRIPQMDWRSASPVHQFPLVRQDFTLDQAAEP